ncbi:hypothetical protein [Sphingobacterium kyonggiense]|uniref:hypothetical protein n=1 Tax=Sphingobacterium kyonggiense TaxID=714075 RepID=UPI0031DF5CAB
MDPRTNSNIQIWRLNKKLNPFGDPICFLTKKEHTFIQMIAMLIIVMCSNPKNRTSLIFMLLGIAW